MRQSIVLWLLVSFPLWSDAFVTPHQKQQRTTSRHHPHSSSFLFSTAASTSLPEGLLKTVSKTGDGMPVQLGDIATVKYACYVVGDDDDDDNTNNNKPFAKSAAQKMVVGDGSMIAGWDRAVRSMRVGERSVVRIVDSDQFGYGAAGVAPVVPPHAVLELDLEILEAAPATANIDFDSLAEADATPRTAADIAAAYQARRVAAAAANEGPQLEGLEAFLAKAKNFYFYGLFEGETGERPPWFLRPSITFPLAFLIVGAAFTVSYLGGAISERGSQSTDELDQIIMSSNSAATSILTALVAGNMDLPL